MNELLTTKQLQELLQVDRVTIYRMLGDGRLRGFKVGGQWRFSREEIERWIEGQRREAESFPDHPTGSGRGVPLAGQVLPLACIEAVQGIYAEALDIATVTIDLEGTPLTPVSNSCAFCDLILATEEGQRRCAAAWRHVNRAQPHRCHANLLCLARPISLEDERVAIAAACQFATRSPCEDGEARVRMSRLADELSISLDALQGVCDTVHIMPQESHRRADKLLCRVADTLAEMGQERLRLLRRLKHIAEVSQI